MNIPVKVILAVAVAVISCSTVGCNFGINPEDEELSGSISGKVYTPVATEDNKIVGVPRSGTIVTVGSCGTRGYTPIGRTCTRLDGSFSFKGLPKGGYCIYIGDGDPASWYLGVSGYPVEVIANQNVAMDSLFTFGFGDYLLSGVARYGDGSVYANEVIELYGSWSWALPREKMGTIVTSEDGSYAFSGSDRPDYIWFESPKGIVATNGTVLPEYAISYYKPWCLYGHLFCNIAILEAEE